jgi:hypothetical protein
MKENITVAKNIMIISMFFHGTLEVGSYQSILIKPPCSNHVAFWPFAKIAVCLIISNTKPLMGLLPINPRMPDKGQTVLYVALFRYPNSPLNFTMQKEDSPSHQNVGTYMEY